jgi:hypothetical protein
MSSRVHGLFSLALAALLAAPSSGLALEKTAARVRGGDVDGGWRAATSCSVAYYNICTGWVWVWNGWSPGDRFGVTFDTCCGVNASTKVTSLGIYVWTGAPPGYSLTGTLAIYDVDTDRCPTGAPLYSQPWLPPTGYPTIALPGGGVDIPGTSFAVVFTNSMAPATPLAMTTDHPAVGMTGPQACGTCYPTTRVNHSFYWGTASTAVCPGSPFDDGVCNAELWFDAQMNCTTTAVEPTSWGALKALYR